MFVRFFRLPNPNTFNPTALKLVVCDQTELSHLAEREYLACVIFSPLAEIRCFAVRPPLEPVQTKRCVANHPWDENVVWADLERLLRGVA